MRFNPKDQTEKYKIVFMAILLAISCYLTYYFHFVLHVGIIFSHFFYIPIILATFWWKRKGLVVPIFLSVVLILTHLFSDSGDHLLEEDYIRSFMFMVVGVVVTFLSERIQKTENRLIESARKFWSVAESAIDGIITTDTNGNIVQFNKSLPDMFGYTEEEIQGEPVSILMPERYVNTFQKRLKQFRSTGEHFYAGKTFESHGLRKDGSEFPFEISIATWRSKGNTFTTSIIRDVTERKKAEVALKDSEQRSKAIIYGSPIPTFVIDKDHNIIYWNNALEKSTKIKAKDVLGTDKQWKAFYSKERPCMADLLVDGDVRGVDHWYAGKYRESKVVPDAYEATDFFPKLGREGKWMYFTAAAIRDSNGNVVGAVETLEDITERKRAEEALQKSEESFRSVVETARDAIISADSRRKIIFWNQAAEAIFGYSADDIIGKSLTTIIPERLHKRHERGIKKVISQGRSYMETVIESNGIRKDGSEIPLEISVAKWKSGGEIFFTAIMRDITERKEAEQALRESEEEFRTLVQAAPLAIIALDLRGNVNIWNPAAEQIFGWRERDVFGHPLPTVPADGLPRFQEFLKRLLKEKKVLDKETYAQKRDGSFIDISISAAAIYDAQGNVKGTLAVIADITDRKRTQDQIKASLEEKEVLLREIHHRVKNNLQIIYSLLSLQSAYIKDKYDLGIFKESQNRVKSMAMIHEKLYQSEDFARIKFADYIRSLVSELFASYGVGPNIKINIKVEDILFDITSAIPCGLIINEILTNSIKHAFPEGIEGRIFIDLHSDDKGKFTLIMGDNGVGLPEDLDFRNTDTLGFQLVNNLVKQLDGTIQLDRKGGTTFKIEFREYKEKS
ncbi:MAG: PAS domain S-box protein [Euryarchaeota archaeon]|nr:PAS domain S-box protein [Euryarchaeota archaeon]